MLGVSLSDFKAYLTATETNIMWYGAKNRCIDQRDRRKNPGIDAYKYSQLIFDKSAKVIQ